MNKSNKKSNKTLAYVIGITTFTAYLIAFFTITNLGNAALHAVGGNSTSLTNLYVGVFIFPLSLPTLIITAGVLTIIKRTAKSNFKFPLYLILFLVSFSLVGILLTIMIQWYPPILVPTQFVQSYTHSLYAALIISILSYGSLLTSIEIAIIAIMMGKKYNITYNF
jgi:hypothetical protein